MIKAFRHTLVTPSATAGFYTTTFWKAEAVALRNQMRSLLTYSGTPWVVSDIAEYTPPANANNRGYAFVARHTSGPEWLFILASRTGSASTFTFTDYVTGTWRLINNNSSASAPRTAHLLLHYNTDYTVATYPMGFDDTAAMTYTVADSKVLTTPDWPMDASFFPANTLNGTMLYPLSPEYSTDPRLQRTPTLFVFEDTAPSISCVAFGVQQAGAPVGFCAVGEIIDPVDPLDTGPLRRSGVFGGTSAFTLGSGIVTQGAVTNAYARFFNTVPTALNASTWSFTGDKTYANDRTLAGVYTGRPLPLGNSKGSLDQKFFLEMGAYNDYIRFGLQVQTPAPASDTLIKINGVNTIPWQANLDFFAW